MTVESLKRLGSAVLSGRPWMVLQGRVSQAPAGLIEFDTTDRLNPATAEQYLNKGYRFVFVT
jgi:hypothetical protein